MSQYKTFEKNGESTGPKESPPKPQASPEALKRRLMGLSGRYHTPGKVGDPIKRRLMKMGAMGD